MYQDGWYVGSVSLLFMAVVASNLLWAVRRAARKRGKGQGHKSWWGYKLARRRPEEKGEEEKGEEEEEEKGEGEGEEEHANKKKE